MFLGSSLPTSNSGFAKRGEILCRPTKTTQPRPQGYKVDVPGVYPVLRQLLMPFYRISLSKGGEGGTEVLSVLGVFCSLPLDITKYVI